MKNEIYGSKNFTDAALKRKQKQFDKQINNSKQVKRYFIDENNFYTYIFDNGQIFKCRGPLADRMYF